MWKMIEELFAASGGTRRRKMSDTELLASIVRSSDDAIVGQKLDGIITSWNAAAERMFGYSAAEMTGSTIAVLFPGDRFDEMDQIGDRIRRGRQVDRFETERLTKSGRRIPVLLAVFPMRNALDGSSGALSISRDLTHLKLAEAEPAPCGAQLAAGRMLHDLRNCLHIISGNEELLREAGGDGDKLLRHADEIHKAVERAAQLVSRLETARNRDFVRLQWPVRGPARIPSDRDKRNAT